MLPGEGGGEETLLLLPVTLPDEAALSSDTGHKRTPRSGGRGGGRRGQRGDSVRQAQVPTPVVSLLSFPGRPPLQGHTEVPPEDRVILIFLRTVLLI